MLAATKILVVEDEDVISNFLSAVLRSEGYSVVRAVTGRDAISLSATDPPDLVLLDMGLPDIDGMNVLKSIRGWSDLPVIIVSARQDEDEKVAALDLGANDYITKPFGNNELLARIRSCLRILSGNHRTPTEQTDFKVGDLYINYEKRLVYMGTERIHLTPIEYRILMLLARKAGKVLTHDFIINEIWGPYTSDNQLLRVNMANIRRKLEPVPADPKYILTEMGVGYRMADTVKR